MYTKYRYGRSHLYENTYYSAFLVISKYAAPLTIYNRSKQVLLRQQMCAAQSQRLRYVSAVADYSGGRSKTREDTMGSS